MGGIYTSLFIVIINYGICVYGLDLERYIPTQEHFVAQQSQSLLHHKIQDASPYGLWPGWPSPVAASAAAAASSSASASSAFSFGLGTPINPIQQQQFYGGNFGLGFGFGGAGWNSYPSFPNIGGIGQAKPSDLTVPTLLKPSDTGWDTSYNVPCGFYKIRPFVIANLRLGTSSSPFYGKRKRRSPFGSFGGGEQYERSLFPQFPPTREPKTCSWNFNSDGPCKLKFKCVWFQLPALFSCNENYMQVSDSTPKLNSTFCGNRKPRKVYNSSSGKLILTFRSQTSSLPAVFDCAVTCTLEASSSSSNDKPSSQSQSSASAKPPQTGGGGPVVVPLIKQQNGGGANNNNDTNSSTTDANSEVEIVSEKPRMRIGDCKCGVQDSHYLSRGRIVGGTSASPAEYPWVCALVRKSSSITSSTRPFCGGTLISDRYALTAAHCVLNNRIIREPRSISGSGVIRNPKELFDILLIEHDISQLQEIPGGTIRVAVDKIIVHPQYDNVTFNFDVALIRLERPIDFASPLSNYQYNAFDFHSERRRFVPEIEARPVLPRPSPICLPLTQNVSLQNNFGIITGWGLQAEGGIPSDELLKATVQIFNDTTCKALYKEYNYPITESMMCAGTYSGKIDACVGDSGGGLIINENERYFLAGITSWGRGCGRKKQPGVYTHVPGLIDWIRSEASDSVWCV